MASSFAVAWVSSESDSNSGARTSSAQSMRLQHDDAVAHPQHRERHAGAHATR